MIPEIQFEEVIQVPIFDGAQLHYSYRPYEVAGTAGITWCCCTTKGNGSRKMMDSSLTTTTTCPITSGKLLWCSSCA